MAEGTSSGNSQQSALNSSVVEPDADRLARDMFKKSGEYLRGITEGVSDDYQLLERMNDTAAQRYADVKQVASNVTKLLEELNVKHENLQPYLQQIDEIDRSSKQLEEAAYAVDAYVKTLEAKFKQLEKR